MGIGCGSFLFRERDGRLAGHDSGNRWHALRASSLARWARGSPARLFSSGLSRLAHRRSAQATSTHYTQRSSRRETETYAPFLLPGISSRPGSSRAAALGKAPVAVGRVRGLDKGPVHDLREGQREARQGRVRSHRRRGRQGGERRELANVVSSLRHGLWR